MKVYKWILCIVLVAAICFCFIRFGNIVTDESTLKRPTDSAQAQDVSTTQEPEVTEFVFDGDAFNNRLLTALNAYRTKSGLNPWMIDENLSSAAKTRATECAILGNIQHKRSGGDEWYTVLGITENYNYSEITGVSGQSPDDLLYSWVASESINSSLLSAECTACGIGCEAIGSDVYCVLILYMP